MCANVHDNLFCVLTAESDDGKTTYRSDVYDLDLTYKKVMHVFVQLGLVSVEK